MTLCETLPFLGPGCFKYQLSMLIVSSNRGYRETLSRALYEAHVNAANKWHLSVHTCSDIGSILSQLGRLGAISIDFVVVCMDTSTLQCTDWIEEVIQQCHMDLRPGRMILVNSSGLPTLDMAVSQDTITAIKRKYQLQLINGNVCAKSDAKNVAKRIHVVIRTTMGLHTGLPHIVNFSL